jgi:hypothetical protein
MLHLVIPDDESIGNKSILVIDSGEIIEGMICEFVVYILNLADLGWI